jgi:hypothetical protein
MAERDEIAAFMREEPDNVLILLMFRVGNDRIVDLKHDSGLIERSSASTNALIDKFTGDRRGATRECADNLPEGVGGRINSC